ncbi:hypothetical protein LEN26_009965 [Aphanomyces euteiches]|nr:hypothetical protein AeMF1_018262 [Aphanomyces euteiches]KAH9123337.1 hypothetical protein LEN26_009965 [Aphanomyces euteiches]KAH9193184.1 hypothetical protein AeNC1_004859 [Aphanomyces euteiches]
MTACPTAATPDGPNAEANVEPLCRQLEAFQAAYARDNHTRRLEHDAIVNRLNNLEYRLTALQARAHNNNRREYRRRGDDLQMIPKLLPSRGRNSANVGAMPPRKIQRLLETFQHVDNLFCHSQFDTIAAFYNDPRLARRNDRETPGDRRARLIDYLTS